MLIYHPETGLQDIGDKPMAVHVGTYCGQRRGDYTLWSVRVARRTSGSKWKEVIADNLPKQLKVEALLLGLTL